MERESGRRTLGWKGGRRSSVELLPAEVRQAVAAAIEDGATIDEITACIRAGGGDCSRSAVGRHVKRARALIREQQAFDRFVEEWLRVLGPRAESRAGLIAIETLRAMALRTMAELSRRKEPATTEEVARLALAVLRIEQADTLRIKRERPTAGAGADATGPRPSRSIPPHDEQVEADRRSRQEAFVPNLDDAPPPESEVAAAATTDSHHVHRPRPTPESSADGEPQDAHDAGEAQDSWDVCVAREHSWDVRAAYASWNARIAHDPAFRP